MTLEKPKLFQDFREFSGAMLVLLLVMLIHTYLIYGTYSEFVSKPFYYTDAVVETQTTKQKNGRSYEVLKLQSKDGLQFYTTAYTAQQLAGKTVRIKLIPDQKITFMGYLGSFFVKTKINEVYPDAKSGKQRALDAIAGQHQSEQIASFYQAIFLAAPLSKSLREQVSRLGGNDIVSLSGFHLAILWGVFYGIGSVFYKPLQRRWFPYRFMMLDLGWVTLVAIGLFVWFVDFPPSLLRSYAMLVIGWMMLLLGIELVSFRFLGSVAMLLLALFPHLMASLGFWLSITGVFYIFLILYWSKGSNKWVIAFFSIPVGVFLLFQPVIHGIFGVTSSWQLISPLLSLVFTVFYPLTIGLHFIGYGGVFDGGLEWLFALPERSQVKLLPVWAVAGYIIISLGGMYHKAIFGLTLGIAALYALYLYAFVQ